MSYTPADGDGHQRVGGHDRPVSAGMATGTGMMFAIVGNDRAAVAPIVHERPVTAATFLTVRGSFVSPRGICSPAVRRMN